MSVSQFRSLGSNGGLDYIHVDSWTYGLRKGKRSNFSLSYRDLSHCDSTELPYPLPSEMYLHGRRSLLRRYIDGLDKFGGSSNEHHDYSANGISVSCSTGCLCLPCLLQPELLSGTIRQNLDPFEQHDDATLHNALKSAGLYSLQGTEHTRRLTLESTIGIGGGNLSVGQRQIIALARALVRGSKLLILDEGEPLRCCVTDRILK